MSEVAIAFKVSKPFDCAPLGAENTHLEPGRVYRAPQDCSLAVARRALKSGVGREVVEDGETPRQKGKAPENKSVAATESKGAKA